MPVKKLPNSWVGIFGHHSAQFGKLPQQVGFGENGVDKCPGVGGRGGPQPLGFFVDFIGSPAGKP